MRPRGAVAVFGLCVLALAGATTTATAQGAEPPPVTVADSSLIAGGQALWLEGVNRAAYTSCDYTVSDPSGGTDEDADGPVNQTSVSAMTAWGIDVVRLPISESCWLGEPSTPAAGQQTQPSDGESAADYRSQVADYVKLLGASGLYVIIDLQSTAPPGYASGGIDTLPDEADAPAFWTSVADAFGGDRFVLFDLINEVAAATWDTSWSEAQLWNCWLNGCDDVASVQDSAGDRPVTYTSAGIQQLIDTVRDTGDTTTPLIIGSPDYDFDKTEWATHIPTDPGNPSDPQLIYDAHLYDFADFGITSGDDSSSSAEAQAVSDADAYVAQDLLPIATQAPVLIGELGQEDCDDATTGTAAFVTGVLDDLGSVSTDDGLDVGVLGWTFDSPSSNGSWLLPGTSPDDTWQCPTDDDGDGGPLLIRDFDGTPTVMGQAFRSWFAAHPVPTGTTTTLATSTDSQSPPAASLPPSDGGAPTKSSATPSPPSIPATREPTIAAGPRVLDRPHITVSGTRLICRGERFAPADTHPVYSWYRARARHPFSGPSRSNSVASAHLTHTRVYCAARDGSAVTASTTIRLGARRSSQASSEQPKLLIAVDGLGRSDLRRWIEQLGHVGHFS